MHRIALALALISLPLATPAAADEGCACNRPRTSIPMYGARAFDYAELARVAGPPPPKGPGGTNCAAAAGRVRAFYRRHGYAKAEVTYEPLMSGDCALRVAEGRAYTIRRVEFVGDTAARDGELMEASRIEVGVPYDPEALDRAIARLGRVKRLAPVTRDDVEVAFDEERAAVDLVVRVAARD